MLPSILFPENPTQYYTLNYAYALQVILTLRFPHHNPVCNFPLPIHATHTAHHIIFHLITQIMFGEKYRSFSVSLCSFLHSSQTSSLLDPHMPLNTIFPNTIPYISPAM